ncbi:MAG: DUF362 domain-containing protein [Anaerolineales bacterium]|nr:DUF362 domain-containing protein [Anaerolineales bacterium]
MRLLPLLDRPNAVLVCRASLPDKVRWDDYSLMGRKTLAAMQVEIESGENAVLKPNATVGETYTPDTGIITHPGFVQGAIEHLMAHGAQRGRVYILEDPRNTDDNQDRHWKGSGYPQVREATGAKLRSPKTYTCVRRSVPNPLAHPEISVSRLATAPNTVLINVPKLKTHNLGITTLCMKNLMGVVNVFDRHFCSQAWAEMPAEVRSHDGPREIWLTREMHEQWQAGLARRLVDLAKIVKPRLNLVEGVVAREGTGFNRGRNRAMGLCIAGVNMVAVDSLASYLMGFDPCRLVYLAMAAEAGLGTNDPEQLDIYEVNAGDVVPCRDLEALRARPALQVISNILGENHTI